MTVQDQEPKRGCERKGRLGRGHDEVERSAGRNEREEKRGESKVKGWRCAGLTEKGKED